MSPYSRSNQLDEISVRKKKILAWTIAITKFQIDATIGDEKRIQEK